MREVRRSVAFNAKEGMDAGDKSSSEGGIMRDGGRRKVGKKAQPELQAKDTWYPRLIKELEQMNHRAETGKIGRAHV